MTFSVTLSKWTVYKYINDGVFLRVTNESLPMGGKKKTEYKKVQAARAPKGESIENRPEEVTARKEPFHWEMDSVLSSKEGWSKKWFLTMTERMSRAVTGDGERTHIFYCHPYSAFERGSNENGNRMIRWKVPKGMDFTGITEDDTLRVQRWVNEYPRGILGGRCAARVLLELAKESGGEGVELLL